MAENSYPKPFSLNPTRQSWISHDGKPQSFLSQFITDIRHVSQARSYLMHFYVLEDAMSMHILLSYVTSECLGVLQFNVPNLVAQVHIDVISLPTPGSSRKTIKTKKINTFKNPLTFQTPQPHCTPSLSPCGSGKRKTAKVVTFAQQVSFWNAIKDHIPKHISTSHTLPSSPWSGPSQPSNPLGPRWLRQVPLLPAPIST